MGRQHIKFQDYYEKLIAGEYKDNLGTQSLHASLWDRIDEIEKKMKR